MFYTVTRTVTIVERWYNVEAASPEEAMALLEDGQITRPPDKDDSFDEWIDAEPDDRGLGAYTLIGEFTETERSQIARLFSTAVPAVEHAGWTITNGHGTRCSCSYPFNNGKTAYCAVERGGVLALYGTSVGRLCWSLEDVYLGHASQDDSGNNRCTTWRT